MSIEVALTVSDRILSVLPGFVLKRYFTNSKLKEAIKIDARPENPLNFSLSSYVPRLDMYLIVTNFTNLVWRLHDLSAEVWIGQPLATAVCYNKPKIKKKSQREVYAYCFLSELQASRVKEAKDKGDVKPNTHVVAYLESKVGVAEFETRFEAKAEITS